MERGINYSVNNLSGYSGVFPESPSELLASFYNGNYSPQSAIEDESSELEKKLDFLQYSMGLD